MESPGDSVQKLLFILNAFQSHILVTKPFEKSLFLTVFQFLSFQFVLFQAFRINTFVMHLTVIYCMKSD